jgi:pSer/pThr/pTyr-binding forkhead associated (FHA) protein
VSQSDEKTKVARTPDPPATSGEAARALPASGDDATKVVPTGPADERTQVLPKAPREPDQRGRETAGTAPGSADDERTRALPTAPPPAGRGGTAPASPDAGDDRTRALPTAPPPAGRGGTAPAPPDAGDDRTRALPATPELARQGGPENDRTVALGHATRTGTTLPGGVFPSRPDAADDEATVVRPQPIRRPRLLVRGADGAVREQALTGAEVSIGRASSCDLVITNPEVSRAHARIIARDAGRVLQVVGSRHNTRVNGEQVDGEHLLRHGDVIELASERLVYAEDAQSPPFDEGAPTSRRPLVIAAVAVGLVVVGAILAASLLGERAPVPDQRDVISPPAEQRPAPAPGANVEQPEEVPPQAPPGPSDTEVARAERIRKLLYEGDIAFLENRLTTPTDGSAFFAYHEALKLDPENARALGQIGAIIEKYLAWAEAAAAHGDRRQSKVYADKAVYLHRQVPAAGDADAIATRLEALGAPGS